MHATAAFLPGLWESSQFEHTHKTPASPTTFTNEECLKQISSLYALKVLEQQALSEDVVFPAYKANDYASAIAGISRWTGVQDAENLL